MFSSYGAGIDSAAVILDLADEGVTGTATLSIGECQQFSCVGPVELEQRTVDITPALGDGDLGFSCVGLDGYVNGGIDLDDGGGCVDLED